MLYALGCFFRSLAYGDSALSVSDQLAARLKGMERRSLVSLRDHALDFVRVIELAIGAIDDASEPCGDCGAVGPHHCPAWCDVPGCDTEAAISSCHQRTR